MGKWELHIQQRPVRRKEIQHVSLMLPFSFKADPDHPGSMGRELTVFGANTSYLTLVVHSLNHVSFTTS